MKKIVILLSLIVSVSATQLKVPSQYSTIQAGIDAASNGDTVLVAAGTYTENINFNGKNIVVGSLYLTTEDTSYISSTIIDGNQSGSVVTFQNGEDSTAVLDGFTIRNGAANYGAGIFIKSSNPTVTSSKVVGNTAYNRGGGLYLSYSNSKLINLNIQSNNVTTNFGGGIYTTRSNPKLDNVRVVDNNTSGQGGGIYCSRSDPVFTNILISKNTASIGYTGGTYFDLNSDPVFFNATIIDNNGAITCENNSNASVTNSIIYENSNTLIRFSKNLAPNSLSINYSIIQGGESSIETSDNGTVNWGTGNLNLYPFFVDTAGGNYRLSDYSPAIGAGTATGAPTTDIERNPRPNPTGSNPDMGAYENSLGSPLPKVLKVPSQYSTIQAGIDAASNGDTVLVAAGTYTENINFNGKNIVVMGENKESTIIDGNKSGSVVTMSSGEPVTATLNGFTIQNGLKISGAGINLAEGKGTLKNLIIKSNNGNYGTAISSSRELICENIIITENLDLGGAILVGAGTASFKNILIVDNSHLAFDTQNGAIVNIINSTIANNDSNRASQFTGNSSSTVSIINSIFLDRFEKNIYSNLSVTYSCLSIDYSGTGNIVRNPEFVNTDTTEGKKLDYHLSDYSPAIGAGTATGAPTTDIEGNPRPNPVGSNPDMGAYENKWGTPQNAPPVITAMSDVTINEDESYPDTLRATDEEGDAITYSVSSDTSAVTTSISDSILTLTPKENWHGVANIKAYASDGYSKDSTSFTLTVTAVNDAPVISAVPDNSTNEETEKAIVVAASDVDGDALTYTATSDTSAVGLTVSSDTLKLTPATNYTGTATITVIVSDNVLTDTTSFNFIVININDSPVISSISDVTINEDETGTATLSATDIDGDAITYSAVSDTNAVSVSVSSATLTLTPKANWNGSSVITAIASDGSAKDSTSFKLTVTPIQDLPTAFEWMSTESDSIIISQTNLSETYSLQWGESVDVDGDSIDYLVYAKIGVYPSELIYDTTVTTLPLTYQEIVENVFEGMPNERATVRFSVSATDGIDTVEVTGDYRVLFVNRYDYLSTEGEGIPTEFALHENYPNPFNPTTTLRFDLPEVSDATVTIYNMLGQKVRTFNMNDTPAGYHSVKWDATNDYGDPVGAGVYLYQLRANEFVKTKKMVLLK